MLFIQSNKLGFLIRMFKPFAFGVIIGRLCFRLLSYYLFSICSIYSLFPCLFFPPHFLVFHFISFVGLVTVFIRIFLVNIFTLSQSTFKHHYSYVLHVLYKNLIVVVHFHFSLIFFCYYIFYIYML